MPMKNVTKIISPAKVNLVLAVGEKQESGFHEVQTIMHSLALHDTLSMRRFDDEGSGDGLQVMLKCESSFTIDPLLIKAEENIAYKAVVELATALGRTQDETDVYKSQALVHLCRRRQLPSVFGWVVKCPSTLRWKPFSLISQLRCGVRQGVVKCPSPCKWAR